MPRVKYKKPRQKKVKPPKPVPPPKPERPRRSELRAYYKDLLSADRDTRVDALAKAMHWYDKLLAYVIYKQEGKWRTSQLREKNAAERDRSAGINATASQKKELEFISSIQHYEKIHPDFGAPRIIKVLQRFARERPKLEARKKKFNDKFGEFLIMVKEILRPSNCEGKPIRLYVDKLKSNFRISSEGDITFDRKMVNEFRSTTRRQGLFPGILLMLPVLSEAAARVPEIDPKQHKTGRVVISNSKRYQSVLSMLSNVNTYYQKAENPRKLIRRVKLKEKR